MTDPIKLKLFAAVREIGMAAEFADQAAEAIADGVFNAASDTEIESAESALITAHSLLDEALELMGELTASKEEKP
jgi:hypothetical protein